MDKHSFILIFLSPSLVPGLPLLNSGVSDHAAPEAALSTNSDIAAPFGTLGCALLVILGVMLLLLLVDRLCCRTRRGRREKEARLTCWARQKLQTRQEPAENSPSNVPVGVPQPGENTAEGSIATEIQNAAEAGAANPGTDPPTIKLSEETFLETPPASPIPSEENGQHKHLDLEEAIRLFIRTMSDGGISSSTTQSPRHWLPDIATTQLPDGSRELYVTSPKMDGHNGCFYTVSYRFISTRPFDPSFTRWTVDMSRSLAERLPSEIDPESSTRLSPALVPPFINFGDRPSSITEVALKEADPRWRNAGLRTLQHNTI